MNKFMKDVLKSKDVMLSHSDYEEPHPLRPLPNHPTGFIVPVSSPPNRKRRIRRRLPHDGTKMRRFAAMMKRMKKCLQRNRENEQHKNVLKRGRSSVKPEPSVPEFPMHRAAKRIKLEPGTLRPAISEPSRNSYHPSAGRSPTFRPAYGKAQPVPLGSPKRRRRRARAHSQPLSKREQDAAQALAFLSKGGASPKSRPTSPGIPAKPQPRYTLPALERQSKVERSSETKVKPEPTDPAIEPRTSWVLDDLNTPLPELKQGQGKEIFFGGRRRYSDELSRSG